MKNVRRTLWLVIRLVFIAAILAFIISRVDLATLLAHAQQLDFGLVLLGFLLAMFALVISTLRWRLIIDVVAPGSNMLSLYLFNLVGIFYSQFLPGNVTGDMVKGVYLGRAQANKISLFSTVVMDRSIGIVINGLLGVVALLGDQVILRTLKIDPSIPIVVLILAPVGLVVVYLLAQRLEAWESRFPAAIASFSRAMRLYLKHPVVLIKAVVVDLAFFLVWNLGFWCWIRAAGMEQFSYVTALLILAAVNFTQVVPISINGWGVREGALILLLGAYGVASEQALLLSLLVAAMNLVEAALGGIIVLIDYRAIKEQTSAPAQPEDGAKQ